MNKDIDKLKRYLVAPELIVKNRLGPYKIVRKIDGLYINSRCSLVANKQEAYDFMNGCNPVTIHICSDRCGYIFYLMAAAGDILLQTKNLKKE